jgi:hypothetical protein
VSPVPPPPPRWVPLRAELERLVGSLARNHVILTTALCALVAAAVFAAFAATLFKPTETPPSAVATTAAIVVVTRAVPAEPTPTPRVRITATAEPWPPFPLDRPVPAGEQPNAGGADPAAVGNFLSRAGQDLGRGLLGGPRAPSTPVAPN